MAHEAAGNAAGQRERCGFGSDIFFAIVAHCRVRNRTGGIEEDVVGSVIARCVKAGGKMLPWRQSGIQFKEAGVSEEIGLEVAGKFVELGRSGENQIPVARFEVAIQKRSCASLRNEHRSSAQEVHHRGHVKNVLIIACKKEDAVRTDRPTDRPTELMLAALRFEVEKRRLRSEGAVAQKIESRSVQMI